MRASAETSSARGAENQRSATSGQHHGFDTPAFQSSSEAFKQAAADSNIIDTGNRDSNGMNQMPKQAVQNSGIKPYQSSGVSNFARYNDFSGGRDAFVGNEALAQQQ